MEEVLDCRDACGSTDQDYVVDLVLGELAVFQAALDDWNDLVEVMLVECVELLARYREAEVFAIFESIQIDFDYHRGRENDLHLFTFGLKASHGPQVPAAVDACLVLE